MRQKKKKKKKKRKCLLLIRSLSLLAADFTYRYMLEDIPLGLCVVKGYADLVNVDTPTMNTVLEWAQRWMKKSYVVDGKLTGSDVGETMSPQAHGFTDISFVHN